ncbi:ferredoxin [Bengtsoniella intestinalis]|uniref:ferredoxin n=1 Tax=Bengtsoniella intestinalis TaxID=3073143 RepID=UPI00391F221E
MEASIDRHCIGCGLCVSTCPSVFTLADTGVAVAVAFPSNTLSAVEQAANNCPVDAIHVEG